MQTFWLALSFLTTLPARQIPHIPGGLSRAALFFPLVGLIIGGIITGLGWILGLLFPAEITAVLLLIIWVALTGGLHLDGLADCCDALFVPADRARRLEILGDPRHGTFAVLALVLALLLKGVLIFELMSRPYPAPIWPLLLAPTLARWLILPVARQAAARPGGLGDQFAQGLTNRMVVTAVVLPLILLVGGLWQSGLALILSGLSTWFWLQLGRRKIGGVTGDLFGAVVESAELMVLLAYCLR